MKQIFLILILLSQVYSLLLEDISISGNKRTKERTILSLANVSIGDTITDSLPSTVSDRLMKSDLFVVVSSQYENETTLAIKVEEKWTVIPYVNGLFSNNRTSIRAGAYDINLFGTNTILGGEYHYFDGTHNGMFFAGKKRLGTMKANVRSNIHFMKGINIWFDENGSAEAGFIADRKLVSASIEIPRYNENLYFGTVLSLYSDSLQEELNSIDFKSLNDSTNLSFSGINRGFSLGLSTRYSGFKYHRITYDGWGISAGVSHSFQDTYEDYNTLSLKYQWYKKTPLESNLAINARAVATDGSGPMSYLYIGGTNSVRGFLDGEFKGRGYLNANAEYRIPSLNFKWLVLQHVFFLDYATITERITQMEHAKTMWGSGLGIRLLSPKIYSFMIRFDYGWGWGPYRRTSFYLGTSHAFLPF